MLNKHFKKQMRIIDYIDDNILRQIKNCIKNSDDISEKYLEMILKTIV
jgi:hypothetical protein